MPTYKINVVELSHHVSLNQWENPIVFIAFKEPIDDSSHILYRYLPILTRHVERSVPDYRQETSRFARRVIPPNMGFFASLRKTVC